MGVVPWVEFNTIDFVRGIQLSSGGISERVIRFLPTLAPPDSPTAESKPPTADAMRQFELNVAKLAADTEINCLMCPITKVYMTDPAIAADGHTYQRDAIIEWFTLSRRSPMTNQLLAHTNLVTNHTLKQLVAELAPKAPADGTGPTVSVPRSSVCSQAP